jgi:hypothetical protein
MNIVQYWYFACLSKRKAESFRALLQERGIRFQDGRVNRNYVFCGFDLPQTTLDELSEVWSSQRDTLPRNRGTKQTQPTGEKP